jgi:hypothetical protein
MALDRPGLEAFSGTALYDPVLSTLIRTAHVLEMEYENQFCDHCRVKLTYDLVSGTYTGRKFIGERVALETTGADWNSFFGQFTAQGLADGECGKFEAVRLTADRERRTSR